MVGSFKYIQCLCAGFIIFCLGCEQKTSLRGDIIIVNVEVVAVENDSILPSKTIVIIDDKIASVIDYDPKTRLDAHTIIKGKGKFIIPGLWDMHFHTSGTQLMISAIYPLLIADGITGVREMSGFPEDFNVNDSIRKELFPGPEIIMGSRLINGMTT